jgi:hypothetical protein
MRHDARHHCWHLPAIFAVLIAIVCTRLPQEYAGSGSETILGVVVDGRNNTAAAGATVILRNGADSAAPIVDSARCDIAGAYAFKRVRAGAYALLASSSDRGAMLLRRLSYADSSKPLDAGTDTLKIPGALHCTLRGGGVPVAKAFCYLRTTSFFDISDSGGVIRLDSLPRGQFTLRIVPPSPWAVKDTPVTVHSGAITSLGVIELAADPNAEPPQVQGLQASYDTARSLVILHWTPLGVSDLDGYIVYRRTGATSFTTVSPIVKSVAFIDTLARSEIGPVYSYAVKGIDTTGRESVQPSVNCAVAAVADSLVATRCAVGLAKNPLTIRIGDTISVALHYRNPTRINRTIEWFPDSIGNAARAIVTNGKEGDDTLAWVWKTPGNQTFIVRCKDDKGDSWTDTAVVTPQGDVVRPATWQRLGDAPFAGPTYLCGVSGSVIYVIARSPQRIYSLYSYETRTGHFDSISACPTNREGVACALFQNRIFVTGGVTLQGEYTTIVECYDLASNRWDSGVSILEPVRDHHLVAHDSGLFLFGGNLMGKTVNLVARLGSTGTWAVAGYMGSDRAHFASVTLCDTIYLVGGQQITSPISGVETFSPVGGTISGRAPLLRPREGASAAALDGSIYLFGGKSGASVIDTCEMYSSSKNYWASFCAMPSPRSDFAVAAVDGTIYLLGGVDGQGRSVGIVERFVP